MGIVQDIETAVALIVMTLVIVGVHELGHLCFAKMFGTKVHSYSIGMGRVLWQKTIRGVDVQFRLWPIGGFVILGGMMQEFSMGKKLWILVDENETVLVVGISKKTLSRYNDKTYLGKKTLIRAKMTKTYVDASKDLYTDQGVFRIGQDGLQYSFGNWVYPYPVGEERFENLSFLKKFIVLVAGIAFNMLLAFILTLAIALPTFHNVTLAVTKSYFFIVSVLKITFVTLWDIFTKSGTLSHLSGMVGVVQDVHSTVSYHAGSPWQIVGILTLLSALISVSVGIMNALPIPPLDGFQIVRSLVEEFVEVPNRLLILINVIGIVVIVAFALLVNGMNLTHALHH